MKRIFTRLLCATMFLFSCIMVEAQTKAYQEEFEGSGLPLGWTQTGSVWQFADGLAVFKTDKLVRDTLITPLLDMKSIEDMPTVTVAYTLPTVPNAKLTDQLLVLYRLTETGSWNQAGVINTAAEALTKRSITIPVKAVNLQVALVGVPQALMGITLDYFWIENSSVCTAVPQFNDVTDLSNNDARINWANYTAETFDHYSLKVSTTKLASPDYEDGDVVDNAELDVNRFVFSQNGIVLKPNTQYYVYVQSVCENDDYSPWAETTFTTICQSIDAGFTENFESELNNCFTLLTYSTDDKVGVSGDFAKSGQMSFAFSTSAGNYAYMYLPQAVEDWSKYQISFDIYADASAANVGRSLSIGYDDAVDAVAYKSFQTITLPTTGKWHKVTLSLAGAAGKKFVALSAGDGDKKNSIYIDNLSLEPLSACLRPLFLRTTAITSTSVTLTWDEVNNAKQWQLIVSPTQLTAKQLEDGDYDEDLVIDANTQNYTVGGLQPQTTYYAYVKSPCNSADLWSEELEFTTQKSMTVPYEEHFDEFDISFYTNDSSAVPAGWVSGCRGFKWETGDKISNEFEGPTTPSYNTYRAYVVSGNTQAHNHQATPFTKASMKLQGTTPTTSGTYFYSGYIIMPAVEQDIKTMQLSFWAYTNYANVPIEVGISTINNPSTERDFKAAKDWLLDSEVYTPIKTLISPAQTTWSQFRVNFRDYEGAGKYIVIRTGKSTATPTVYIDDIVLEDAPDCQPVMNLEAEAVGTYHIKASWDDEKSTEWQVLVSSTNNNSGDIYSGTVTTKSFYLEDKDKLQMGQKYYISVTPVCGEDYVAAEVTTLVGMNLPYVEDFLTYTSNKYSLTDYYPKTWKHGNADAGGNKADGSGTLTTYQKAGYVYKATWSYTDTLLNRGINDFGLYSSKNRLILYASNGTAAANKMTKPYVILPQIYDDVAMSDINISLWALNACSSGTSGTGSLGTSTVYGTYAYKIMPTKLKIFAAPDMSGNTENWTLLYEKEITSYAIPEYISVNPTYTGKDKKYIVIMQEAYALPAASSATSNYLHIDYLEINKKSDKIFRPADLNVASVSETGGTLSWSEQGTASKYNVRVYTSAQHKPADGSAPYLSYLAPETPSFKADNTTSKSLSLTGLKPGTRYFVYVQAVDSKGNVGDWSIPYVFMTRSSVAKVPFYENFDNYSVWPRSETTNGRPSGTGLPEYYLPIVKARNTTLNISHGCSEYCWSNIQVRRYGNSSQSSYWYRDFIQNYENYKANGLPIDSMSQCFYMNASGNSTAAADTFMTMLVLPPMDKPLNKLRLEFYAGNDNKYAKEGTSAKPYAALGYYSQSKEKFVKVADAYNRLGAKTWDEFRCDYDTVNMATLPSDARIAIRLCPAEWKQYEGVGTGSVALQLYIDNISVTEIPVCRQVETPTISNITTTSATATWKATDEEKKWEVLLSETKLTLDDTNSGETVTELSKTFNSLEPNTTYYVYVRSVDEVNNCKGQWSYNAEFTTLCNAVAYPYYEDFTQFPIGSAYGVPDCMRALGQNVPSTFAYVSYTSIDGKRDTALSLNQGYADTLSNYYFVFPELDIQDIRDAVMQISVNVPAGSATGYYYERLYSVGVMTDPTDYNTFVSVKSDNLCGGATATPTYWDERQYEFTSYQGYHGEFGKYVAIRVEPGNRYNATKDPQLQNKYGSSFYIRYVKIGKAVTCFKPTAFQATEVGQTTATFTWNTENPQATQHIRLFASEVNDPLTAVPVFDKTVTGTSAVFSALKPLSAYYAYMRTECAEDDLTDWVGPVQINTECPDFVSLPYSEGFENMKENVAPDCWTSQEGTYTAYTGTSTTQHVNALVRKNSTTYPAASGTKLLHLGYGYDANTSGGDVAYAVSPKLDIDNLSNLVIYFQGRSASSDVNMVVSAVKNADDRNTKDRVVLTKLPLKLQNAYKLYYLDLSKMTTGISEEILKTYKYIRFEPIYVKGSNGDVYIDDIVFTTEHKKLDVSNFKLNQFGDTYACISFSDPMEGTEWELSYGLKDFVAGEGTQLKVTQTVDTITGLTPGTEYDIYVRSIGGNWVGPVSVTTIAAGAATVPYNTNFEDAAERDAWNLLRVTRANGSLSNNYFIIGDAANCGATGTKALYITDDGQNYHYSYDTDNSYSFAYRYINITEPGTYKLEVRAKNPGSTSGSSDYVAGGLVPANCQLETSKITRWPSGSISISGAAGADNFPFFLGEGTTTSTVVSKLFNKNDWNTYTNIYNIKQPGTYMAVFHWYATHKGSNLQGPAAIDSISIEEYKCTEIENLKLNDVKGDEASFTWYGAQCKDFEVVVSTLVNSGDPALLDGTKYYIKHEQIHNGANYTIGGLEPNTNYAFYVRTICEWGYTEWKELDFKTTCLGESVPYTQKLVVKPLCWTYSTNPSHTTLDYQKNDGESKVEFWDVLNLAKDGVIALPEFDRPLNELQFVVTAFAASSESSISLGVVNNPTDFNSFEALQTTILPKYLHSCSSTAHTCGTEYVPVTASIYLSQYQFEGKYLAMKAGSSLIYIKEVKVVEAPPCLTPQSVMIDNISTNSARIDWIPIGSEEKWIITANGVETLVDMHPFVLTNLSQGTTYSINIRAFCDDENQSESTDDYRFTTDCDVSKLPFYEDFTNQMLSSKSNLGYQPNCWLQKWSDVDFSDNFASSAYVDSHMSDADGLYTYQWYVVDWDEEYGNFGKIMIVQDYTSSVPKNSLNRWLISPQYTISSELTTLSFDAAYRHGSDRMFISYCTNKGWVDENGDPSREKWLDYDQSGVFKVMISTDNGQTWKTEDVIKDFDLKKDLTGDMQTFNLSLKDYVDKTIRVALYFKPKWEDKIIWTHPYLLIDNLKLVGGASIEATVCPGQGYYDNGFNISPSELTPGTVNEFSILDAEGNIVLLSLTVSAITETTKTEYLCEGTTYTATNGMTYTDNATFFTVTQDENGCLTRQNTSLVKVPSYKDIEEVATICQGESYTFNNETVVYDEAGYFEQTVNFQAQYGCDSIVTLKLNVLPSYNYSVAEQVCQGEPFSFAGKEFNTDVAGTTEETFNLKTLAGCDSIVNLTLTVNPTYNYTLPVFRCYGESYEFDGVVYTSSTQVTGNFKTVNGCDSIVTLQLTVGANTSAEETVILCKDEMPYEWNGTTYTEGGDYEYVTQSLLYDDCDSIVTLHLIVGEKYNLTIEQTACLAAPGTTIDFNGYEIPIDNLGTYTQVANLKSQYGCDSIVTLVLTVLPTYNEVLTDTICIGDDYTFNNQTKTYNQAGLVTEVANLQTVAGCDSIVTLNLYVGQKYSKTITVTICEGESYPFHGVNYTESTTETWNGVSSLGCDSVEILELTVKPVQINKVELTVNEANLPWTDGYITIDNSQVGTTVEQSIWIDQVTCEKNEYKITVVPVATSTENVVASQLGIYPNPVQKGDILNIKYDFSNAQLDGIKIQMYNAAGMLINTYNDNDLSAGIQAPAVGGMYTMRILTGTGETMTAKFVVR